MTTTPPSNAVLLNDFQRLWNDIGAQAGDTFQQVGQSGWYILGRQVQAFERSLADWCGVPWGVGCASGLDALELGLRALDLQRGDKVLTTPLSAFATTLAILRAGGEPVFVDVDQSGLLDLDLARTAFEKDPSLKTMVPVHLYGRAVDLKALAQLKDDFGVKIVEDMAQAIGASSQGMAVGTVGQISAVSFYPTKNLGCLGDGGAVLTPDELLAERCRQLRDYGQTSKYVHTEIGMNSRLDELQAALLEQVFLPKLQSWTDRRKVIAQRYCAEISHPRVRIPGFSGNDSWHLYVVRAQGRDDLQEHLRRADIQSAVHYPVLIPDQPCLSWSNTDLPVARSWAAEALSIPIHPYLGEDEVSRVIQAVNDWGVG